MLGGMVCIYVQAVPAPDVGIPLVVLLAVAFDGIDAGPQEYKFEMGRVQSNL